MQNEWRFQTSKLLSFMWLKLLRLSSELQAKSNRCSEFIHCDLSIAKVMTFLEGSVQTLIVDLHKFVFRIFPLEY